MEYKRVLRILLLTANLSLLTQKLRIKSLNSLSISMIDLFRPVMLQNALSQTSE